MRSRERKRVTQARINVHSIGIWRASEERAHQKPVRGLDGRQAEVEMPADLGGGQTYSSRPKVVLSAARCGRYRADCLAPGSSPSFHRRAASWVGEDEPVVLGVGTHRGSGADLVQHRYTGCVPASGPAASAAPRKAAARPTASALVSLPSPGSALPSPAALVPFAAPRGPGRGVDWPAVPSAAVRPSTRPLSSRRAALSRPVSRGWTPACCPHGCIPARQAPAGDLTGIPRPYCQPRPGRS